MTIKQVLKIAETTQEHTAGVGWWSRCYEAQICGMSASVIPYDLDR